jgi:hypothetical protein
MTPSTPPPAAPSLPGDILLAVENLFDALSSYVTVSIFPATTKTPTADLKLYADAILTDVRTIWRNMVFYFGADAVAVETSIRSVVENIVAPLAADASGYWNALLADIFASYDSSLKANATVDPAGVVAVATSALDEAATLGLGSRIVTAAFELVLPKKLNVLNWLGPILANFSGFDEIISQWREPQIRAAIGRLAEYNANTQFRTAAPDHADAEQMFARRLITSDQLNKLIAWSGLMSEFEAPMLATAYRAIQPRMFATLLLDQPFPSDQVQSAMEFAGLRPDDVTFLLGALEINSTKNVRQQYLAAAVRSTELGTMTPQDLDGVLTSLNFSDDAKSLVQLTVATRKLEQLAELYRKSISEAYRYGQITDAQYVPALEAIGIGSADAQAHYAIDSIAQRGRLATAAAKAEARLEASRTRAATQAAIASYRAGTIDEAALSLALIAAGVDAEIAAFLVTVQTERRAGPLTFVYGVELSRDKALVLKENVAAVEDQYKKQLIDDTQAANALSQLGLPERNATPLLATWAALKVKPTTTGERLPR